MEQLLGLYLTEIQWPRETLVCLEFTDSGRSVYLDVDLPEIEDLPTRTAAVAKRGNRLEIKEVSATEQRKRYMHHVHAVGFRLLGEVFATLPTAENATISGYSQRRNAGTGRIDDEYLYSARANRSDWEAIDLNEIRHVDPVEAIARFEIRRPSPA